MLRRAAVVAGLAALALLVNPGARADETTESTYTGYHRAIRAYEICNDHRFDQAEHEQLSTYIDRKIDDSISVGRRLTLIEHAKAEMGDLIDAKGCDAPEVQDSLSLFSSELQPALAQ